MNDFGSNETDIEILEHGNMEANDILIVADNELMASFVATLISKGKANTIDPNEFGKMYQYIDGDLTNHAATIRTQDICDERYGKCRDYRIIVAMDSFQPEDDIVMIICLAQPVDRTRIGFVVFNPGFEQIFGNDRKYMVSYINGNMDLHKGHSIITSNF